jgi:hypothetical protein
MRSPWRALMEVEREMGDMFAPLFHGFPGRWAERGRWPAPAIDTVERTGEVEEREEREHIPGSKGPAAKAVEIEAA